MGKSGFRNRTDRDAINIVYKSLQKDNDYADISSILRELHKVVDEAVETRETPAPDAVGPYDISKSVRNFYISDGD